MEYRTLDVTIVSAEDLKKVNLFRKLRPFAVAWVTPNNRNTTFIDSEGGGNPSWNQRFSFSLPDRLFQQPGHCLHIEIYSKGSLFGDKFVGAAAIPLSELNRQSNTKELVTYQLRRRSGKVKGSVRLLVQTTMPGQAMESPEAVMAYPYDKPKPQQSYEPQRPIGGYGSYPPQQPYPQQGYYPPQQYQPYPPQGYYPPQQYTQLPQRPGRTSGMGGMGTGLLAGALGGLLVGEVIGDAFDHDGGSNAYDGGGSFGGGYDGGGDFGGGSFGGGYDGGGFGGDSFGGGYDGGGDFGGGGFDGGF